MESSPPPTATVKGDIAGGFTDERSCELFGPTALVVQAALGVLVLLSLVYKRHRESYKRPWRIWLFDVSKQVVGQMFVHGTNVLLSDLVSKHREANACVFYFLHILLDTTLGVGALYLILRGLTFIFAEKLGLKGFESGIYGTPPSPSFWLRQAMLYVLSLTTMKILVISLLIVFPHLFRVGEWLLSWMPVGKSQVIFVMGIFPIAMNVLQFWLIDSIVKASVVPSVLLNGSNSEFFTPEDREPLFHVPDDENDDGYRQSNIEEGRSASSDQNLCTKNTMAPSNENQSSREQTMDRSSPQSLSSSITSLKPPGRPREARNLQKKVNRIVASTAQLPEHVPLVPMNTSGHNTPPVDDGWAETWEDAEDWEGRAREEDKMERGIDRTSDALHDAWIRNTTIQVAS